MDPTGLCITISDEPFAWHPNIIKQMIALCDAIHEGVQNENILQHVEVCSGVDRQT